MRETVEEVQRFRFVAFASPLPFAVKLASAFVLPSPLPRFCRRCCLCRCCYLCLCCYICLCGRFTGTSPKIWILHMNQRHYVIHHFKIPDLHCVLPLSTLPKRWSSLPRTGRRDTMRPLTSRRSSTRKKLKPNGPDPKQHKRKH